ncbi:MAG: hypothetical protein NUW22_04885 [Acidobacteria bacterium]|nr:hypothetical protein [Acidobacteriota bacterium]
MRIQPGTGRVAHGIAGDGVYVDGVRVPGQPPTSGMPDWWGGRAIYVAADGRALRSCAADGSDDRAVADGPVAFVRASRHGWAAWHDTRGVWTSWGLSLPFAVLLDMAPDGALVVGDDYQSGVGLSVHMPGMAHPVWKIPDARPVLRFPYSQVSALSVDRVMWIEQNGRVIRSLSFRPLSLPWTALHPTLCEVSGQVWLTTLRAEDDAVIAVPWAFDGRGVTQIPGGYGPAWDGGGLLHWSVGAGELPEDMRQRVVTAADVGPIPAVALPPVVVPPSPPPPAPTPELPRLGVTIDHYTPGGPAPFHLTADYHVEGHGHAPVQVYLTLDGQRVAMETEPAGQLETTITEPGEYRLGAVVDCAGRRAQTGAVRIVRVQTPVIVPPIPPVTPVATGRDAYTVAAQEARAELAAPVEPPEPPTPDDQIPASVWRTIRRVIAALPFPHGDGSEAYIQTLREWTRRLCEQLRYTHGPEWGHKATSPGAPPSKESIARKIGPDLHVWDMLIGASSGAPRLSDQPSHYHVNDQHFIAVDPVDHLAAVVPPPARAQIPQPWIGLTAFDLGVRLESGDRRWVEMMAAAGFTVARVVVASVYRTVRTPADGLRQLPLTLAALAGAGLKAEVVVLVDTRDYDMTRSVMRDYLRAVMAICQQSPSAIAGIEIANESTHSTQVIDLADPVFLRELSELVPQQFAISWGSSHGGEAPYIGQGSYITHHADRDRSPEENAGVMAEAQRVSGQLVIDDEALGIAETQRPGARTDDPAYGERQARAARVHRLGGVTLHIEAGLAANVDLLGSVQREAITRFVAAMRAR